MTYASLWFKNDVLWWCEKAGVYATKANTRTPKHCNIFFRFSYKISFGMLSRLANLSGLWVKTCIKACWWGLPMGLMRNAIMAFSSPVNQWEWPWYPTFNRYTEFHNLLNYSQFDHFAIYLKIFDKLLWFYFDEHFIFSKLSLQQFLICEFKSDFTGCFNVDWDSELFCFSSWSSAFKWVGKRSLSSFTIFTVGSIWLSKRSKTKMGILIYC